MSKFIYIITSEISKKTIDKGILKLLPEWILIKIVDNMYPKKVISKYFNEQDEEIKGYGIEIFVPPKNNDKQKYIDKIIKGIELVKDEQISIICIDRLKSLQNEEILQIEQKYNIEISNGKKNNMKMAWDIINRICNYKNINIKEKEILFIGDETKETRDLVLDIAKDVKYLTILAKENEFIQNLTNEIFNNTGLSIHVVEKIEDKLKKYRIIINSKDDYVMNINNITKKTIIFDLGITKTLSKKIRKERKSLFVVNDLILKKPNGLVCDIETFQFDNEIESYIYEILGEANKEDFRKIVIGNKAYTIKDALKVFLK